MESRTTRITELLAQKSTIDAELETIRQQMKDEKSAFKSGPKKERKKRRTKTGMAETLKVAANGA